MITPLDIRKLTFNKKWNGYDVDEVRASLESISKAMEDQSREAAILRERIKLAEEKLNHFKLIEKTLQESVLTMQTTLEEKRKSAEQEANLIIQEAKHKAASEVEDYLERIKQLKTDIVTLDNQKNKYFIRFKNFLSSQLDWLEAMEKAAPPAKKETSEDNDFRKSPTRKQRIVPKSASQAN